ncbi:MAG: hypothetical protein COC06_09515 [Bacteroidales bacterium]|nr:MAG: hypothetical protein COC06_09515 [Bacteroidales bacterium]
MLKKYFYLVITLLFVSIGCSDFIEEDIEDDVVVLLGPANGVETESQSLSFWWDYLDGASAYRLQIVRPDFKNMISLELDTLISANSFLFTLYPGNFEWRVRAENSAYFTEYTSSSLIIREAQNISEQKIVLISPQENTITKNKQLSFTWNEIGIADNYTYEIYKDAWNGEAVIDPVDIEDSKLDLDLEEGKYSWGVKANDTARKLSTPYASRTLYVDYTAPNEPVLSIPDNKAALTGLSQTFEWNYTASNEISSVSFVFQISKKTDFTSIEKEEELKAKTVSYTFSSTGTYYWRVKAVDKAGNESYYSSANSLTIS